MRSLPDLRLEATRKGVDWNEDWTRKQIMDALRDLDGPVHIQIDPMKAKDLKRSINWNLENPFDPLSRFFSEDYRMEPKLDGCRMRLYLGGEGDVNTMNTGRRSVKTNAYIQREDNFPLLRDALMPGWEGIVLDGEMIAPSAQITTHTGNTTNSLLNATVALTNTNPQDSVRTQEKYGWATFHAFDLMMIRGKSVMNRPYMWRRTYLDKVVARMLREYPDLPLTQTEVWSSTEHNIGRARDLGYEGVMVKHVEGVYEPGKRSRHWHKIKLMSTFDAFVMGYVPGEGRNEGLVGGLKMGLMIDGVPTEVCRQGVFTDEFRRSLSAPDGSLLPKWKGQVMELMGQGVTKDGRIRHPHLIRLRPDKTPADCDHHQFDSLPRL